MLPETRTCPACKLALPAAEFYVIRRRTKLGRQERLSTYCRSCSRAKSKSTYMPEPREDCPICGIDLHKGRYTLIGDQYHRTCNRCAVLLAGTARDGRIRLIQEIENVGGHNRRWAEVVDHWHSNRDPSPALIRRHDPDVGQCPRSPHRECQAYEVRLRQVLVYAAKNHIGAR